MLFGQVSTAPNVKNNGNAALTPEPYFLETNGVYIKGIPEPLKHFKPEI